MKYIVTVRTETQVAILIEAESEDGACEEVESLIKEGRAETLDEFLDPRENIELDWSSNIESVEDAVPLGYANRRAANQSPDEYEQEQAAATQEQSQ